MPMTKGSSKSGSRGSKSGASKRGSGKRELISPRGDKRYARRDGQGQFKESDDVGKSLSRDQKRKAKARSKAGRGDRGDR